MCKHTMQLVECWHLYLYRMITQVVGFNYTWSSSLYILRAMKGKGYSSFDWDQFTQTVLLLYLLNSHTTPLHKPDSPFFQS